ncbi:hypothetical protein K1T71_012228 [Dendrolimus kikuchii]|uniref:Uncharacterized protein n=1 Tax=Dendrolimus kikuchii TaxID=765133 RepID=A0ACC1CL72_9NEOP|nr:hypothetical protein K1T71_012228 [Dendrolimus kikuchii]
MSSTLCSMWLLSVVALLAVDVRTGALQQRDMGPRQCHQCIRSNLTTCEQPSDWSLTTCNADQPYCATTAIGPDFISALSCSPSIIPTCTLKYSENHNMELTCICTDSNCNLPFSRKLRSELIKFSYANVNSSNENITNEFFNFIDTNITDANYKRITVGHGTNEIKNVTRLTTVPVPTVTIMVLRHTIDVVPRVEALKQNAATPSDDDEDESEGSGSYEETRSHQAAAPQAPSSFLPANDNKATTSLFTNILLFIPILVYLV